LDVSSCDHLPCDRDEYGQDQRNHPGLAQAVVLKANHARFDRVELSMDGLEIATQVSHLGAVIPPLGFLGDAGDALAGAIDIEGGGVWP